MTELSEPQSEGWESALQRGAWLLDNAAAGPARLRGGLRQIVSALRESVESVRRLVDTIACLRRDLRAEQERLSALMERLPFPYLLTAGDGTIMQANPAASRALSVSARALVGRNLLVFLDDRDVWMQVLTQVMVSRVATRHGGRLKPRERLGFSTVAHLSFTETVQGPAIQWCLIDPPPERAMQGRLGWPARSTRSSPPSS